MSVSRETVQKLSVLLEGDKELILEYIQTYGDEIKLEHINAMRTKKARPKEKVSLKLPGKGTNPVYTIDLECPVCRCENLSFFELRAKSQFKYYDQFMVPMYAGIGEFIGVPYTDLAVCICPECYFASPDKKDFISFSLSNREKVDSQIPFMILKDLENSSRERVHWVEAIGEKHGLFKFPRSYENTILSYKLALMRNEACIENDLRFSKYKKGAYWLRIALILRQNKKDDAEALTEAAKSFEQAYAFSDFPNADLEFQTVYTLFAIYLRLDNMEEGRKFLALFDQSLAQFESGERSESGGVQAVKVWKDKALNLWEAREDEDLWAIPKPR